MTWTSELPAVPGWYWWRHNGHIDHVTAYRQGGRIRIAEGGGDVLMTYSLKQHAKRYPGSEWAGPIPPPAEPS